MFKQILNYISSISIFFRMQLPNNSQIRRPGLVSITDP